MRFRSDAGAPDRAQNHEATLAKGRSLTDSLGPSQTRRDFLRYGGSLGAALAAATGGPLWRAAAAVAGSGVRPPDSLPDPSRPAGTVDPSMPFDHFVVIMMENHSFDNALGALALSGQPKANGLKFSSTFVALNSNPGPN